VWRECEKRSLASLRIIRREWVAIGLVLLVCQKLRRMKLYCVGNVFRVLRRVDEAGLLVWMRSFGCGVDHTDHTATLIALSSLRWMTLESIQLGLEEALLFLEHCNLFVE